MRISQVLAALSVATVSFLAGIPTLRSAPTTRTVAHRADTLASQDPIARLQSRLDAGGEVLRHDSTLGYLPALLRALDIPGSSQSLVFSRTSLQVDLISPASPRALYFNDDVYVGFVRGSDFLEIATASPEAGVAFYTLHQEPTGRPVFARETSQCLMCHQSRSTGGMPGFMMLSTVADRDGFPITSIHPGMTTDATPMGDRFGGWYVTGSHGAAGHSGNVHHGRSYLDIGDRDRAAAQLDLHAESARTVLTDRFDTRYYLNAQSDIVALMVLAHQTSVHNLIIALDRAARHAQQEELVLAGLLRDSTPAIAADSNDAYRVAVERLLRGLLFMDEAPLDAPVRGTTSFQRDFSRHGPRDAQGRSLRDLDLERHLFRHPLSFLIDSEAFARLPAIARHTIYRRLRTILEGRDPNPDYARIPAADRAAVLEILRATTPAFAHPVSN